MADQSYTTPDDVAASGPPFEAVVTCYPTSPDVGNRRGVCVYLGDHMIAWVPDPSGDVLAALTATSNRVAT